MIHKKYRSEYNGEFIVLHTKFVNGQKQQEREWVDNQIVNNHISKRAAVIGSNTDIEKFDYTILQHHKGGLLASKKLQTYGTDKTWSSMPLDFFVTAQTEEISKIIDRNYDEHNIVYTTAKLCVRHPGHFYLVPYTPYLDQLALAVYLAAFDEHNEVFLLGYNNETPAMNKNWMQHVNEVFRTYDTTKFYLVGTESNMPAVWRKNKNVSCLTYRNFISYCDIG